MPLWISLLVIGLAAGCWVVVDISNSLRSRDPAATPPDAGKGRIHAPTRSRERSTAVARASRTWGQARVMSKTDLDEMDAWFHEGDDPADYR